MTLPAALLLALRFLVPVLVGAVLGLLYARWLYSCHRVGHAWERYEIEAAHYRDPAAETLRVCRRCGHVEIGDDVPPTALETVDEIPPVVTEARARKPRPTKLPSDGTRVMW